jgi:hypothetical protein
VFATKPQQGHNKATTKPQQGSNKAATRQQQGRNKAATRLGDAKLGGNMSVARQCSMQHTCCMISTRPTTGPVQITTYWPGSWQFCAVVTYVAAMHTAHAACCCRDAASRSQQRGSLGRPLYLWLSIVLLVVGEWTFTSGYFW